jgi:hypothetical protein
VAELGKRDIGTLTQAVVRGDDEQDAQRRLGDAERRLAPQRGRAAPQNVLEL